MKKILKKISTIFIGLIVVLLVLEIVLRIIGYVHIKSTEDNRTIEKDDYVILCIGDSYTEGVGAPKGKSYPEQLEWILNKRIKKKKFKVINKGVSSYNTFQVLDKFKKEVDDIEPDLVVLLAGVANQWNFYGYRQYLNREDCFLRIKDFLCKIKIYKLIKLLVFDIKGKNGLDFLRDRINIKDSDIDRRVTELKKTGYKFVDKGKYYKAIQCFKKILEINPKNSEACLEIALIYTWSLEKERNENEYYRKLTVKWVKKAIELNIDDLEAFKAFVKLYREGSVSYDEYIKILSDYKNKVNIASDILIMSRRENKNNMANRVSNWVYSDIEKIIFLCKTKNIHLIIQNYPYYFNSMINNFLKDISTKYSVFFVDNYGVFENMWLKGYKKNNYFSLDLHCNTKGYNIIAKNVFLKINKIF